MSILAWIVLGLGGATTGVNLGSIVTATVDDLVVLFGFRLVKK